MLYFNFIKAPQFVHLEEQPELLQFPSLLGFGVAAASGEGRLLGEMNKLGWWVCSPYQHTVGPDGEKIDSYLEEQQRRKQRKRQLRAERG